MSAMPDTPQRSPAAELDPVDLYCVRSMLTDEERLVQESVARFVDDHVIPIIGECFEHERFPRELVEWAAGQCPRRDDRRRAPAPADAGDHQHQ